MPREWTAGDVLAVTSGFQEACVAMAGAELDVGSVSVDFVTSLRYEFKTLFVLARYRLDRRWALLRKPAAWIAPSRD